MPYALCSMPYARRVPHVTEKGYRCVVTQTTRLSVLPICRIYCLPMPAVSVPLCRKTRIIYYSSESSTNLSQS